MPIDITAQPRRVQYDISGTGPYDFDFEVLEETDVAAYRDATLLTLTTDYTVTINEDGTGSITLVSGTGSTLTILGARPYRRLTDYQTGGDFTATTVNDEFDSLQIQIQQLDERLDRAVTFPAHTEGLSTEIPEGSENMTLGVDSAGNLRVFDPAYGALTSGANVNVLLAGTGAVSQTVNEISEKRVWLSRFGAGPTKTAAQNNLAFERAKTFLQTNYNGGVMLAEPGEYDFDGEMRLTENLSLEGGMVPSGYDGTYATGGTVWNIMSGDFGLMQQVRQSALRNIRLVNGASVPYGLVVTGPAHITEQICAQGFEYGIAAMNLNQWMANDLLCLQNTKVGFSILPVNEGAVCFPLLEAYDAGQGSTTFDVRNLKVRENHVGMAVLDGINGHFHGGLTESNTTCGIVIFKRTNCDELTFTKWWQENDTTQVSAADDFDGIELFTQDGGILKGDISGVWNTINDGAVGIWIGSADEVYDTHASGSYQNFGGPAFVTFKNCHLVPNRAVCRPRSAKFLRFEDCHMQSALGSVVFQSPTTNCYMMDIVRPHSSGPDAAIWGMTVGGTMTSYEFIEAPIRGTHAAAASAAWKVIVDVETLTPNLKYEYSIGILNQSANYWQTGFVWYDGTDVVLINARSSISSAVRISSGVLEYQQNSGGALNISFRVRPAGRLEFA